MPDELHEVFLIHGRVESSRFCHGGIRRAHELPGDDGFASLKGLPHQAKYGHRGLLIRVDHMIQSRRFSSVGGKFQKIGADAGLQGWRLAFEPCLPKPGLLVDVSVGCRGVLPPEKLPDHLNSIKDCRPLPTLNWTDPLLLSKFRPNSMAPKSMLDTHRSGQVHLHIVFRMMAPKPVVQAVR